MIEASAALRALGEGLQLGVQYNPLIAAATAAIAAALSGYPRAPHERRWWSALVLLCGWLTGDGLRVVGRARDLYDGVGAAAFTGAPAAAGWVAIATWAACGFALGYLLPASAGMTAGRRVTHGTGWLAAAAVAGGLSLALTTIVGALS